MLDWIDAVASIVHSRVRDHPPGESLSTALREAFVASIDSLRSDTLAATRAVFSSPRLFNAYSEHQRRWVAALTEVLAERLGTDPETDPRPDLWSTIAFAIALRASYRATMGDATTDLRRAMREAFGHAAELFDPLLDIGERVGEAD